jgi:predicted ATP-dependent serine protease
MLNLALTVILADQRCRQCPCGAVADRPFGLCRKCQDRKSWRRKSESTHRKSTHRKSTHRKSTHRKSTHRKSTHRKTGRRRIARRVHDVAGRFPFGALAVLSINNGLEV